MAQIPLLEFLGFGSLKDILDVVLVPLILGVFGLVFPKMWERRQKSSETKTKLVTAISELVMSTVMSVYLVKKTTSDAGTKTENILDDVYKKWVVETCVIGSELHAYFPDPQKKEEQLHRKWRHFSDKLSKFFETYRVKKVLDEEEFRIDKEDLFNEKAIIIGKVLTSTITGFRPKYQK